MKIQYGSNFGQFKWTAEADVTDELVSALVPLGALQIAQRSPSTAAEKEMAGYEKRPKGFDRNSIEFSDVLAETLAKHLRTMKVEVGRNAKDEPIFAEVTAEVSVERKPETEKDVVMNDERDAYARHGKAGTLEKLAGTVGFDGEDYGDGTRENAPVAFLRAIRDWSKAQTKGL